MSARLSSHRVFYRARGSNRDPDTAAQLQTVPSISMGRKIRFGSSFSALLLLLRSEGSPLSNPHSSTTFNRRLDWNVSTFPYLA